MSQPLSDDQTSSNQPTPQPEPAANPAPTEAPIQAIEPIIPVEPTPDSQPATAASSTNTPLANQAVNSAGTPAHIDSKPASLPGSAAPAPNVSKPAKKVWSAPSAIVGLVVLGLAVLGGTYWYVSNQFKANVTVDHAEHMQMSPGLHEIMHIRQKLLIGTDANFEPMEYVENGKMVGFDIDLGRAIAKELNVPAEFVPTDFDSIFGNSALGSENSLTKGSIDMVISAVTITEERQKYYLFSNSYLNAGQVALTTTTNTSIHSAADLKGKIIAVAAGTSNETLANTLTTPDKVTKIADPTDQAKAVAQGKADAMLVDLTNAKSITANNPSLKIATDPLSNDYYGIVMAKGKEDVRDQVDQILDTLQQRGDLESLKQKWLE